MTGNAIGSSGKSNALCVRRCSDFRSFLELISFDVFSGADVVREGVVKDDREEKNSLTLLTREREDFIGGAAWDVPGDSCRGEFGWVEALANEP